MISRVRFDDVLWATSDPKLKGKELAKFKKHIEWCKHLPVPLSPAILCQDIEQFPGTVEYIKEGIQNEILFPDLHGWDHENYGARSLEEILEHLDKAINWFQNTLDYVPMRWVTPHGANSPAIQDAARRYGLIVEDTREPVIDQKKADTILRQTRRITLLNDRVIMVHWWERGLRLYRIARILQHEDVEVAIAESKRELDEKSWKICWDGW